MSQLFVFIQRVLYGRHCHCGLLFWGLPQHLIYEAQDSGTRCLNTYFDLV